MPEIVIPDLSHSLCLEQLRKTLCDVVGLDQIADLIDTYILKIFLDVAASAQAAVFLLLCRWQAPAHSSFQKEGRS